MELSKCGKCLDEHGSSVPGEDTEPGDDGTDAGVLLLSMEMEILMLR